MGNDDGLDTSHPAYGLIPGSDTDSSVSPKSTSLDALADGQFQASVEKLPVIGDSSDRPVNQVKPMPGITHSGNSATAQANTLGNGTALTNTYLSPVDAYLKTIPEEERNLVNRLAPQLAQYGVSREAREVFLTDPKLYGHVEPNDFAFVARRLNALGAFNSAKALSLESQLEILSNPDVVQKLKLLFTPREDSDYKSAREYLGKPAKNGSRVVL